jgi:ribokinase
MSLLVAAGSCEGKGYPAPCPAHEGDLMADVLVVGSINVDFVVHGSRLPGAGETVSGGTFERHFGGKGANQAVAAARLGADVALVGAVGDDELGMASLADLRTEGIDIELVARVRATATGVALIVVDAAGENQIAVASGANQALDGQTVTSALSAWRPTAGGGVLLAVFEVGDDAISAGARFAALQGLALVVNLAPARPLPAAVVDAHAIVVANQGEAEALTGLADPQMAARELSTIIRAPAVVTLGANGAALADRGKVTLLAAPSVEVVDTTGAGDAFAGAFAAELAGGAGIVDAVRMAVAAAALSVTSAGARAGMPRRAALDAFVQATGVGHSGR